MRPHADQGDRPRERLVRRACRRTRAIAAGIGRAGWHHPSLHLAPRRPRLSVPRTGRGDPARPTTRRTHCNASYRTRSAARLDRSASSPGELKNDPRQSGSRPRPGRFSLRGLISRGGLHQCLSEKSSQGEPARGQRVPFSGLVEAHTPGKSRVFAPAAVEGTGETDSPAEEERFEPSVPPGRERPKRSNEAVSVQITIAPSGARSLAAARLCRPSLSSLRRAELCAKHIYI